MTRSTVRTRPVRTVSTSSRMTLRSIITMRLTRVAIAASASSARGSARPRAPSQTPRGSPATRPRFSA
eukprot:13663695-Alexandrium_andersonii.AAC.1